MRFILTLIFSVIFIFSAQADEKLDEILNEIKQIKKDLKVLEKAVYSQSFKGSSKNNNQQSGSLEGALTRQLVKITELEEQMQKLTAGQEEVLFSFEQLNDRFNKSQADNNLRLSDLESGDVKISSKKTAPKKFPGTDKPQNLGTVVMKTEQQETSSVSPAGVVKIEQTEQKDILPDDSPEKQYKFATSLIKVGDYDKAELALKEFVKKNSKHKLAGNAQYWYAETFYIRQLYHDAAAAYLDGYQKYPESSKGPQNLLKLGVTLSELGEKDQGCQMLNGITQQYPKASQSVIQKAKYEKKKYKCPKIG